MKGSGLGLRRVCFFRRTITNAAMAPTTARTAMTIPATAPLDIPPAEESAAEDDEGEMTPEDDADDALDPVGSNPEAEGASVGEDDPFVDLSAEEDAFGLDDSFELAAVVRGAALFVSGSLLAFEVGLSLELGLGSALEVGAGSFFELDSSALVVGSAFWNPRLTR